MNIFVRYRTYHKQILLSLSMCWERNFKGDISWKTHLFIACAHIFGYLECLPSLKVAIPVRFFWTGCFRKAEILGMNWLGECIACSSWEFTELNCAWHHEQSLCMMPVCSAIMSHFFSATQMLPLYRVCSHPTLKKKNSFQAGSTTTPMPPALSLLLYQFLLLFYFLLSPSLPFEEKKTYFQHIVYHFLASGSHIQYAGDSWNFQER